MVNRPKQIGTTGERYVVNYLRAHGFPNAERRALAGAVDLGDVVGIPNVCIEIKAGKAAQQASDGQITKWLDETRIERANSHSTIGFLVLDRAWYGEKRVGDWWAILPSWDLMHGPVRIHLSTMVGLLMKAGFGDTQ